jgi:hypothetical protein
MKRPVVNKLSCQRCGEESEPGLPGLSSAKFLLHLSPLELDFIQTHFQGQVCILCARQLKTAYKIQNGGFNSPLKKLQVK